MKTHFPTSLATLALAALFVLVGCDIGGVEETAILNAESPIPPTVEYTFEYTSDDVNSQGQVEKTSEGADDLGTVLSQNGFAREDVVSAEVDSVTLERLSSPSSASQQTKDPEGDEAKVFEYLVGAEIFLGQDAGGTLIADDQFQTTDRFVSLDVATRNVTEIVQAGSTSAFLRLDTEDPDEVPDNDVVQVTVYYQIEAEGV